MSGSVLDNLRSKELQASACGFSTAPALRLFFAQRPEIYQVQEGLRQGTITEGAIRDFVADLIKGIRPGVYFSDDLTLAALAVACENVQTPFVDTLLRELAELRLAEMPLGPRMARDVLAQRASPGGQPPRMERVVSPGEPSLPTELAKPSP
jgi:hypothetical protein